MKASVIMVMQNGREWLYDVCALRGSCRYSYNVQSLSEAIVCLRSLPLYSKYSQYTITLLTITSSSSVVITTPCIIYIVFWLFVALTSFVAFYCAWSLYNIKLQSTFHSLYYIEQGVTVVILCLLDLPIEDPGIWPAVSWTRLYSCLACGGLGYV